MHLVDLRFGVNLIIYKKWFPHARRRTNRKKELSQLNETLIDFLIGNNTNVSATGNETLEPQTNGCSNTSGRVTDDENNACQIQVNDNNIHAKNRKAVDNAVRTVENGRHDAIVTAMDNVVSPRVEINHRAIGTRA